MQNKQLTPAQERKYRALKADIVASVKSLSLNNNRIEALVEQLYDINKRLISHEGRLMRLAESHGVAREEFLKHYQGWELDPKWSCGSASSAARAGRISSPGPRKHPQPAREHPHLASETGPGDPGVPQHRR
jgi:RNA polymerase primary sigma factor